MAEVHQDEIVTSPIIEISKKTRSVSTATKRARAVSKRKAKGDEEDDVEVQEDKPEQKVSEQEPVEQKEEEAPRKIAASRKVSRKVQKLEDTDLIPEQAPIQTATDLQAEVEMQDEVLEEIATQSTPPPTAAVVSHRKEESSDREQSSSQKETESDEPISSSSPKRFSEPEPFIIEPLKKIPKLTPAEEEMTVEAWLKTQVLSACQEMENEGKERIEKLRQQIGKGRTEIEAVLRGRSVNTTVS